jgi:hypothetical protein
MPIASEAVEDGAATGRSAAVEDGAVEDGAATGHSAAVAAAVGVAVSAVAAALVEVGSAAGDFDVKPRDNLAVTHSIRRNIKAHVFLFRSRPRYRVRGPHLLRARERYAKDDAHVFRGDPIRSADAATLDTRDNADGALMHVMRKGCSSLAAESMRRRPHRLR